MANYEQSLEDFYYFGSYSVIMVSPESYVSGLLLLLLLGDSLLSFTFMLDMGSIQLLALQH